MKILRSHKSCKITASIHLQTHADYSKRGKMSRLFDFLKRAGCLGRSAQKESPKTIESPTTTGSTRTIEPSKITEPKTIPTIDISAWISESSEVTRNAVVEEVRNACVTYGFFQLVGHGIPLDLQSEVFECAQTLFALPVEEKMEVSIKKSLGLSNRGYEAIQGQTLQTGMLPDLKEVSRA